MRAPLRALRSSFCTTSLWACGQYQVERSRHEAERSAGEHYALEVRGDSMVDAGILDGDMALIQRNETADTGDIVVALIDDEEATLKRFRRRGASIALEPANTSYEVRILPPNRVKIQGKLIGLYRKY